MARYSKKERVSEETKNEALALAKGTQQPGQSKEQTRLIAQGVQKGIDLYKKQQKAKARELDRRLKKAQSSGEPVQEEASTEQEQQGGSGGALPWSLLILSWLGFAAYLWLDGRALI